MNRRFLLATVGVVLIAIALPAQTDGLQRGFSSLELGMDIDTVKELLRNDAQFAYRGDADVSFLPSTRLPIIETAGVAFVERAIFQFRDERLFVISLLLNRRRLDHYSVFTALVARYGEPVDLDPSAAVWDDGTTRISLERPLTVKYIDRVALDAMIEGGRAAEALDAMTRELFLDGL
ncbi:MAG: hypothetical protein EA382_04375 [Spirochaetaceae bacterium]|nr:MAG: hypothetical protein EA382_04375 [Spirochaetaceae bacterium]